MLRGCRGLKAAAAPRRIFLDPLPVCPTDVLVALGFRVCFAFSSPRRDESLWLVCEPSWIPRQGMGQVRRLSIPLSSACMGTGSISCLQREDCLQQQADIPIFFSCFSCFDGSRAGSRG